MRLRYLWSPILLLVLAACGGDDLKLEKGPFLKPAKETLEFEQEFYKGTYIGASTFNTLTVENGGDQPLEITDVIKPPEAAFTMTLPEEFKDVDGHHTLTLQSRGHTFIQVQFKPTKAQQYNSQFTIKSNALNTPSKDIVLSGTGLTPP
jgi:hypothetical protein